MKQHGGGQSRIADRINAERLVLLGWPCAILMQVAHPLVAAGVARHSTFRTSATAPVRRLHHTVRAMLGLTFGSAEEQARVIGTIRQIHTRVHGTLDTRVGRYPAGARYSAEDPALVLWVHATLIRTTLIAYESLVRALTPDERDDYCAVSAHVAIALGAEPAKVPREWQTMVAYVDAVVRSGDLAVGEEGRALGRALLHGAAMNWTGPVAWAQRVVTAAWLPADVRELYGIAWTERRERRHRQLIAGLRLVRRWTPDAVACWAAARRTRRARCA